MRNADMPATPLIDDKISTRCTEIFYGLTKREAFAMAAMQGILSGGEGAHDEYVKSKCRIAVEYADALLSKLSEGEL